MVAVPLRMALGELCSFIGPHLAAVASVAVLRDVRAATGSYMALIRFRSQAAADDFFTAYNGRLFASFDNQVCATCLRVVVQSS